MAENGKSSEKTVWYLLFCTVPHGRAQCAETEVFPWMVGLQDGYHLLAEYFSTLPAEIRTNLFRFRWKFINIFSTHAPHRPLAFKYPNSLWTLPYPGKCKECVWKRTGETACKWCCRTVLACLFNSSEYVNVLNVLNSQWNRIFLLKTLIFSSVYPHIENQSNLQCTIQKWGSGELLEIEHCYI